ncbi:hypothetical protein SAMN04488134_11226 [Amphibacillus marinus]|uniref:Uncharacterized protein n=1 Tax=Amphibacillus marinus TaxID=872970 RepID=A0A1H8S7H9_9BACI|nr:hypothetical protein [Amphibacillus marinus]SEO74631.1 hypothetical protein SAMN04488134_11226 [Amphibacillus marinus]
MPQILNKPNQSLPELIAELSQVSDQCWGLYAFEQDLLKNKFTTKEKHRIIIASIACGYQWAETVREIHGDYSITQLVASYGLQIEANHTAPLANRIGYALYTPPKGIELMTEPIAKVSKLLGECLHVSPSQLTDIILAHELYHHIECEEAEVYTQMEQVVLWRFLFYKHRSQVRAASEIAAMSFAQQMNKLNFSPFVLDVLLAYAYNPLHGERIYQQMIKLKGVI